MKKSILLSFIFILLISLCYSQDLDTVSFVDQIDSGQRGGNSDDGPAGSYNGDWSFQLLTNGTAGLSGADVNYMNTFSGQYSQGAGEIESPVYDVTLSSNTNPDRAWTITAYPANNRSGATSANNAVLIGDDGGHNDLGFGEWDDQNYDFKVDVYLRRDTGLNAAANEFVRYGIGARIQQDYDVTNPEIAIEGAGFICRPTGCYALLYDSSEGNVYPCIVYRQVETGTWADLRALSLINKGNAAVPVLDFLGSAILVSQGWHTLGIRCTGSSITFTVDESTVEVTDTTYLAGKAGVIYRTSSGSGINNSTYDHGSYFDYIRCEPAPPASAHSWELYL